MVDAVLATAVLTGLVLNAALAGGGPTPPPATSSSSTRHEKSATSSAATTPAQPGHLIPWEHFRDLNPGTAERLMNQREVQLTRHTALPGHRP